MFLYLNNHKREHSLTLGTDISQLQLIYFLSKERNITTIFNTSKSKNINITIQNNLFEMFSDMCIKAPNILKSNMEFFNHFKDLLNINNIINIQEVVRNAKDNNLEYQFLVLEMTSKYRRSEQFLKKENRIKMMIMKILNMF